MLLPSTLPTSSAVSSRRANGTAVTKFGQRSSDGDDGQADEAPGQPALVGDRLCRTHQQSGTGDGRGEPQCDASKIANGRGNRDLGNGELRRTLVLLDELLDFLDEVLLSGRLGGGHLLRCGFGRSLGGPEHDHRGADEAGQQDHLGARRWHRLRRS